jgi:hypothetical protein
MRTLLNTFAVLCASLSLAAAQDAVSSSPAGGASGQPGPQNIPYQVVKRDRHSRTWERTVFEPGPGGQQFPRKHAYTELRSFMHYRDDTGQWQETSPDFEITPQGYAAATHAQHQVIISPSLTDPEGVVDLQLPYGKGRLRSAVLGLVLRDSQTGKSLQVAAVKNAPAPRPARAKSPLSTPLMDLRQM